MYIYKITHKSTHQSYVGQSHNPFQRWEAHTHGQDLPIQKSIREEGINNFTFEILEECSEEEVDNREAFWINYYHAYGEGYNTNRGNYTDGLGKFEPVPVSKPSVTSNNRGSTNSPDGVDAYDPISGKLVAHYPTIAAANRAMGAGNSGNISAVCRGRGRTAYGYIWKYTTPQN